MNNRKTETTDLLREAAETIMRYMAKSPTADLSGAVIVDRIRRRLENEPSQPRCFNCDEVTGDKVNCPVCAPVEPSPSRLHELAQRWIKSARSQGNGHVEECAHELLALLQSPAGETSPALAVGDEVEWQGRKGIGVVTSTSRRVSVCFDGKHSFDVPVNELKRVTVSEEGSR